MGFEPTTFCMASSRWVCHGPAKCLQTNDFREARPRAGVPRIVRRYRGFRQGTDNERSLALGGSAGSRVAVESASASTVREPDSCCSSRRRPRRTNPAAHRGRGSTSACPQEQQRRASRFRIGRHLCLVHLESAGGRERVRSLGKQCGRAGARCVIRASKGRLLAQPCQRASGDELEDAANSAGRSKRPVVESVVEQRRISRSTVIPWVAQSALSPPPDAGLQRLRPRNGDLAFDR